MLSDTRHPTPDIHSPHSGPIGIVILAAGKSARMGQPKQLLAFRGKTLLRHTVETALALPDTPVVVVLGAHIDRIRPELGGLPVTIVENLDWQTGMGTSLRAGLNALLAAYPQTAAALFLLCDQPYITPELLRHLETEWRQGANLAACRYETRLGVPAIFGAALFAELLALQGAEGARQLLAQHKDEVSAFLFPAGAIDVDRPADYAALLNYPQE